jgi:hypothetical protein
MIMSRTKIEINSVLLLLHRYKYKILLVTKQSRFFHITGFAGYQIIPDIPIGIVF